MDAMIDGVFDAASFYKLAGMFNSPYRDEANKLLGLALSDLRKGHNLVCDQCGDAGYAKARRDECAGLRYDLKQAFARYAEGELDAEELQNIIARVAERSTEIEQDVLAPRDIPNAAPSPPSPSFFDDFHIPQAPVAPAPLPEPAAAPEIEEQREEEDEDEGEDENIWAELRAIFEEEFPELFRFASGVAALVFGVIAFGYILDVQNDPGTRERFTSWFNAAYAFAGHVIEGVLGIASGLVLLWLLRKALPLLGWVGLSLKLALAVDCFFVCYLVGFHETPWSLMLGGRFPALARPVYPFVIVCVLAAGLLILPEVMEWFRQRASRLRLLFFTAAALIAITVFVDRNRIASPPPAQNVVAPTTSQTPTVDCAKTPFNAGCNPPSTYRWKQP